MREEGDERQGDSARSCREAGKLIGAGIPLVLVCLPNYGTTLNSTRQALPDTTLSI